MWELDYVGSGVKAAIQPEQLHRHWQPPSILDNAQPRREGRLRIKRHSQRSPILTFIYALAIALLSHSAIAERFLQTAALAEHPRQCKALQPQTPYQRLRASKAGLPYHEVSKDSPSARAG